MVVITLLFSLILIALIFVLLNINKLINNKTSNNQIYLSDLNYEITSENYTNKNININYPQITNLKDDEKQKKVNKLIKNEALKIKKVYANTDELTLNINYNIWKSNNLLSIQYSGIGYVKGAAYPNNLFYTTNIIIDNGNRITKIIYKKQKAG